jgi:hypothetical protein
VEDQGTSVHAERIGQLLKVGKGDTGSIATLEARDARLRYSGAAGELSLGPAFGLPKGAHLKREGSHGCCVH